MTQRGLNAGRPRLSAFDALIRGLANLRANWELVFVLWAQALAVTLLTVAGALPLVAVFDLEALWTVLETSPDWLEAEAALKSLTLTDLPGAGPLAVAVFAALVAWLLAFLVYCWFQAGVYGILRTGDRQAPPGVRGGVAFRTFALADLSGWGRAHAGRYFWLVNLFMVLATLWLIVPFALIWLVYVVGLRWGTPAAFGLGCGGLLPVLFGWIAIGVWANLAMATAARPEAGVRRAARDALRILGRRLGAALMLLFLLVLAASFVAVFFAPVSLVLDLGLASNPAAGIAASVFLTLLQWLATAFVGGWFSGAYVALARSESGTGGAV